MFAYEPTWSDAAVRRFLRRVGPDRLDLLFALRRADNAASGVSAAGEANERALIDRIRGVTTAHGAILAGRLAIDGNDLQATLGISPSPALGALLDALLERVLDDPSLNRRETLLDLARDLAGDLDMVARRLGD